MTPLYRVAGIIDFGTQALPTYRLSGWQQLPGWVAGWRLACQVDATTSRAHLARIRAGAYSVLTEGA